MLARIIWTFLRQWKEMNEFLDSKSSVNRSSYHRMLALGSLDAFITLPITILGLVEDLMIGPLTIYQGWSFNHSGWAPVTLSSSEWKSSGFWSIFSTRLNEWINPLFAVIFFLLFGTTQEARAWYRRTLWLLVKPFGLKPKVNFGASSVRFGSLHFNQSNATST